MASTVAFGAKKENYYSGEDVTMEKPVDEDEDLGETSCEQDGQKTVLTRFSAIRLLISGRLEGLFLFGSPFLL